MNFNENVFNSFPVLKTERLILREITQKDVKEVYEIYSSVEAMRYFGKHPMKTIEEAEERINETSKAFQNKEGIRWALAFKDSDKLIGSAGIWRLLKEHLRGEIGYELIPEHWNKGIMSEALSEIINFGFTKINLHTIEANIDPQNNASLKLLEKLGFKKEGQIKDSFYFNGKFEDTAIYSLIKNES